MSARGSWAFEWALRVRWAECDPQGVVFNANYLGFYDIAFTEWVRSNLGDPAGLLARGVDAVLGEFQVKFLAPARFDDELDIRLACERVGETSLHTRFETARASRVLSQGVVRHVFVSPVTLEKAPIPSDVRAAFSPQRANA